MKSVSCKNPVQRTRENCDKARNEQQKSLLLSEVSKGHVERFQNLKHAVEQIKADVQVLRGKLQRRVSGSLRKAS